MDRSERVDADAPLQAVMAYSDEGGVRNLVNRVGTEGYLDWTAPVGEWTTSAMFNGGTRNQAHGSPANLLDLYAAVDIPGLRSDSVLQILGDAATPLDPFLHKFASSGGPVAGRDLISSETATWLGEHSRVSLSQVKAEVDLLFTAGVNHNFVHGPPSRLQPVSVIPATERVPGNRS